MPPWHPGVMSGIGRPRPCLISSIKLYDLSECGWGLFYQYPPMPSTAPGTEEYSINGRWTKRRKGDRKKRGRKEKKE